MPKLKTSPDAQWWAPDGDRTRKRSGFSLAPETHERLRELARVLELPKSVVIDLLVGSELADEILRRKGAA